MDCLYNNVELNLKLVTISCNDIKCPEDGGRGLCFVLCGRRESWVEGEGGFTSRSLSALFFFMVVIDRLKVEVRQVTNDNVICNDSSEQVEGPWRGGDMLRRR